MNDFFKNSPLFKEMVQNSKKVSIKDKKVILYGIADKYPKTLIKNRIEPKRVKREKKNIILEF